MNRTDTLLRLKRFRVDEMKRRIAAIDAMKFDLERKLADLDDNVAREKQRAGDSDIGRLAFPSFLRSIEARRENLRTTLKGNRARTGQRHGWICRTPSRISSRWKSLPNSRPSGWPKCRPAASRPASTRWRWFRHLRKHTLRSA